MKKFSKKLQDFLLQGKFITLEQLNNAEKEAGKQKKIFEEILVEYDWVKDSELGQIIAEIAGWNFVNLSREEINNNTLLLIPRSVAEKQKIIAFAKTDEGVKVAMDNPDDTQLLHLLQKSLGSNIIPYYATQKDLTEALHRYQKDIDITIQGLVESYSREGKIKVQEADDSAIVRVVDLMLADAYQKKASDVHIEPHENQVIVRYRIDGVMQVIIELPKAMHEFIVTRIKILSHLRTDEHHVPQDGKIQYDVQKERIDIRVSISPTTKGENVVMRLLVGKTRQLAIADLGLSQNNLERLEFNIKKPWGMILVTGPTGSGKTTSLYGILKVLNRREVNIATIEDPVEYNVDGITQIQVNQKAELTFASGLRSLVRQDPDIIMVGEIRDQETAEIAVNSAMTGHLVLSTLHTNDAATTLPRLLDMDIEPFLVASTVNIAIAQRLVRKICPKCIQSYESTLKDTQHKLSLAMLEKLSRKKDKITLYKGKGCNLCHQTGYEGRIGIFEILEITEDIRSSIMNKANADDIRRLAIQNGMTTMFDDALDKVQNGITTVEEMLRVVR